MIALSDNLELLESASEKLTSGERGAQSSRGGREETASSRGPRPRPSRAHRHWGALQKQVQWSPPQLPWSSLALEASGGAPKRSSSGSLSLCRYLRVEGCSLLPNKRAVGRFSPAQPKGDTLGYTWRVCLWSVTQTGAKSRMGTVYEAGEVKV